jgi:hypothetical protein
MLGRNTIHKVESWSKIAQKGVKLIDVLLEAANARTRDTEVQLSIEDVVRMVGSTENATVPNQEHDANAGEQLFTGTTAWDDVIAFFNDFDSFEVRISFFLFPLKYLQTLCRIHHRFLVLICPTCSPAQLTCLTPHFDTS